MDEVKTVPPTVVPQKPAADVSRPVGAGQEDGASRLLSLKCPKCGATAECAPPANCGDCLMERVEIVPMVPFERPKQPSAGVCDMSVVDEDRLTRRNPDYLDRHRFGRGLLVLAVLLTLGAGSAQAGSRTEAYAIWCSAKAADLASTELALSRGGYESNPLMKDRGVRFGAGVASCVVAAEADHKLRKHKKSRIALRVIGLGLLAYATQRNARTGR